jgi:hypothetical protein
VHPASGLTEARWWHPAGWTLDESPVLAWEGCRVHAIDVGTLEGEPDEDDIVDDTMPVDYLRVDFDYIVRRVEPETPGGRPMWWVAPATLDCDAGGITAAIGHGAEPARLGHGRVETTAVLREVRQETLRTGWIDPDWRIAGDGLDIRVQAAALHVYIRQPPLLVPRPLLDAAERGGVSFARKAFA